jgi:adenine deaminase
VEGHINDLCKRAVKQGIDVFKILQAACVNPVEHYKLDVGLLREGDNADFIIVKDLVNFEVIETYIDGVAVARKGKTLIDSVDVTSINKFNCKEINASELAIDKNDFCVVDKKIPVIEALDGQLITNRLMLEATFENEKLVSNIQKDILKIVVVNRYANAPIAKGFIRNFGLKKGAIASSVAHDSHNIISVGTSDEHIVKAVNLIIKQKGGVSCVDDHSERILALPIAGLMSAEDGYKVAKDYIEIDKMAKELGSTLKAPFMTLSFMALLVIPHLKLSDKGLFDGDIFQFVLSN